MNKKQLNEEETAAKQETVHFLLKWKNCFYHIGIQIQIVFLILPLKEFRQRAREKPA